MKRLFILMILFSFFGELLSQTERYIYQTEVNPDTINLVNMKVENTFLDINNNHSLFISESKLIKDSLSSVLKQQRTIETKKSRKDNPDFPKLPKGKSIQPTFFEYFITKDMNNKSVDFVENVGSKQIYYQEDRKMNWDISTQVSDFNGYKIQKATLSFGGRIWTAWFAPEVKISDGPYKFFGLPGLILKLEDDKGDYRFSLLQKIIVPNAFSETIRPDARKSTRINFQGDKAAVRLEMVRSKNTDIDFDPFNPTGKEMNKRGDLNGNFSGQQTDRINGGMPDSEVGNGQPEIQTGNSKKNNAVSENNISFGNTNPIELSNK